MSQAIHRPLISVEEYLAAELQSDVRHEYLAGIVVLETTVQYKVVAR